jgi:hypothetical protein
VGAKTEEEEEEDWACPARQRLHRNATRRSGIFVRTPLLNVSFARRDILRPTALLIDVSPLSLATIPDISPISRPLPPIARSVSTPPSSTIASYSTTPGERHTDLPLEPPFSPPSSSSTVSLKRRSSTRARAASIGVEGPLGLQSDDDDDDDDDDEGDGDRTLLAGKVDSDESGTDGLRLRRVPTVTAGSAY